MNKLTTIATAVSPEVAEAVDAFARQHKLTRSQAMHKLLAKATDVPLAKVGKRGRPKSCPDTEPGQSDD